MRLIEGAVVPDDSDDAHSDNLHAEIDRLRIELSAERRAHIAAKRDASRAMGELRRQLGPLYKALQMVFGELDAAGIEEMPPGGSQRAAGQWDEWKTRLGPNCGKVIDALLLGGEMTITSICVAAKIGKNTAYQATSKMGQAGILIRNGSKFSLKQL